MWKFADLPYARPDFEGAKGAFRDVAGKLRDAKSFEEAEAALLAQDKITRDLQTVVTIASIRNTLDTTDAFYDEEMMAINRAIAELAPLQKAASEALLDSPYRAQLEAKYGKQLFTIADLSRKTQDESITAELIEEGDLCIEYQKITAGCHVEFMGEDCNFYGLLKQMENPDRAIRREAFLAWAKLYEDIADQLDDIYDKLTVLRVRMAEKLGFPGFTELGYAKMTRADYGAKDVASFREQVLQVIVPAVARYREEQAKRIGVDKLRYYDEAFMFPEGNADPVGGEDVLMPIATKMYRELSPETGEFFDFMVEHGLFDLTATQGKHLGGYCTYLPNYDAPFIFANFNGTAADTGVLTHEAGHAFQVYQSARCQPLVDYSFSTSEVSEIHSMSMEHFTYPWLGELFGEANAKKAKFTHLCDALSSIPYLVSVDEFQHRVYEKPDMKAKERRAVWREIEKKYMPWRDYDGMDFLEEGGFWMQKQHIFLYPFYYIDYALAQTCAFELYGRMKTDSKAAWADYLRLCEAGGSLGYLELLKLANLSNPFEGGAVQRAVGHVIEELDTDGV